MNPQRTTDVSLAWSIPVMILLCMGLGYAAGRHWGRPLAGLLAGWVLGMICTVYELWKLSRAAGESGPPRADHRPEKPGRGQS